MRSIMNFGELKVLNPRVAWPTEARGFTQWLASHTTSLGDVLDMQLELTATETRVGDFSLDILAKDLNSDRQVIIENHDGSKRGIVEVIAND
jgi:bisphosphoglycerate-dependent phosphoglycerate mutase